MPRSKRKLAQQVLDIRDDAPKERPEAGTKIYLGKEKPKMVKVKGKVANPYKAMTTEQLKTYVEAQKPYWRKKKVKSHPAMDELNRRK